MSSLKRVTSWLCLFVSSGFFSGFLIGWIRKKPGSGGGLMGSIIGVLISIFIILFFAKNGKITETTLLIWWTTLMIITYVSIFIVPPAERLILKLYGKRERHTGEETDRDFNETNIDEIIGVFLACVPSLTLFEISKLFFWISIVVSFLAFRFFDTKKIWGIKKIEKSTFLNYPFDVLLDDIVAGIYTMLVTYGVVALIIFITTLFLYYFPRQ